MKYAVTLLILCTARFVMAQGTNCLNAIPITMDGAIHNYASSSATGGNVICTGSGTSAVTWFSFSTNAAASCPLLNISASDNLPIEISLYSACGVPTNNTGMCFYDGQGLWAPSETFPMNPSQNYYLRIKTGTACTINIAGQHYTPTNTSCAGALSISNTPMVENNACHQPPLNVTAADLCANTLENTAFYQFIVGADGSAIVNISSISCDNGAADNSGGFQIGFFTGTCSALVPLNCTSGTGSFVQATTLPLTAGTKVFVAIDGMNGSNCQYTLQGINAYGVLSVDQFRKLSVWKTASANIVKWETENDGSLYYQVERSLDGKHFKDLKKIDRKSASAVYEYEDKQPSRITYYRIRQVNAQGKVSISNTVMSIRDGRQSGLQVINITGSSLKAIVETNEAGLLQYQLISTSGQVCRRGILKTIEGINQMELDISRLPAGKYQLVLQGRRMESSVPVVKKY